ncbi:permease prefix domain 1-containing protein [Oceanobacillus senegalensis]|uniref:permease prefix domain 1-containing protein n=1 Tax=Oceanobacillus senegalensis TaxID=1936063 RepID=UPI000A30FEEE|nr:permease prefix domain 1-containing protein [Oceanobacillus senegalensis]
MTNAFEKFVEKAVQQIEGNQEEKDDLYEELMVHLEMSKNEWMEQGLSEKEAEAKAMEHFGNEVEVGEQIQQAMFPLRKEMMRVLATVSIIFSIAIYLVQLFDEGDAYILWLVLSMVVSTFLFIFSIQSFAFLNRRLWMNSLLVLHIAIYLFGLLLTTGIMDTALSTPLFITASFIILLAIILIYRTTIHDYMESDHPLPTHAKWLHILNMTAGVGVIGFVLFFLWGILVMTGMLSPSMIIPLIPLLVWIILYIMQMNLIRKRRKKVAFILAIFPLAIIFIILWYFSVIFTGL